MQPSAAAIALVKASESLRLEAYPDPGTGAEPWTIGWGHTDGVHQGMRITAQQAEDFLAADLAQAGRWVSILVKVPLSQGQFDALTDFVFNEGPEHLRNSHLLAFLNAGDVEAAAGQFKFWVMAGGRPLAGLVTRRAAEEQMFRANMFAGVTGSAETQAAK